MSESNRQSEIRRGHSAVVALPVEINPDKYIASIAELLRISQQGQTDSRGFRLGLSYQAWLRIWVLLSTLSNDFKPSPEKTKTDLDVAHDYYREFRSLQSALDLTDEQVASDLGETMEQFQAYVSTWVSSRG